LILLFKGRRRGFNVFGGGFDVYKGRFGVYEGFVICSRFVQGVVVFLD